MKLRIVLATICVVLLNACGGGGGGGSAPQVSGSQIRNLTGAAVPIETPGAQRARSPGIVARADSLIVSTVYGETDHSALPTFRLRAGCSGTQCSISESSVGYIVTLSPSDFEFSTGSVEAVGTKHGITLMSQAEGTDFTSFGAWMEHSGFAVQHESATIRGTRIDARYGLAGGELAGTAPTGNATWLGIMVGMPATGNNRGDRLQGDATLSYDLNAGDSIDVAFSSIKNIDRGTAHSTPTVMFNDVPIATEGTFQAGLSGNRIQGGFYGPGNAEAAGVFEQSNIVGAFGAKKQ